MPYLGRSPGSGVRSRFIYAATSGQTSFSGNDSNSVSLAYEDTLYMDVYQNGVLLKPVTDYAATTGTSVVLTTGATTDDVVEMIVYDTFAVADTVSAKDGGTFAGNIAVTGNITTTGTVEPAGDTAAGDNAAIGFTSAEGLILTGQGSTSDITLKNDADATVAFVPTGTDDLRFPDDAQIQMGASGDLVMYHNGSNSFIEDNGTGNFLITTNGNNITFMKNQAETMAVFKTDGACELYNDNALKLTTTSTGVDVTGIAVTDGLTSSAALDVTTSTHANASVFKSTGETQIMLQDTNASSDDQFWGLQVSGGTLNFLTCDDDRAGGFVTPFFIESLGNSGFVRSSGVVLNVNRNGDDGALISLQQGATTEGLISVSGTTVTYAGGHLARWSRLSDNSKDTSIVKGTVMTNLDQMVVWTHAATDDVAEWTEDNEQLNCTAVSSVEGDPNVAGVFVSWDNEDDYNDFFVGMTGDMVIRIANGTTVTRGDLLMSAGDGTAKPQGDDIVRSKTIAKVTSTTVSHTYDDGTFLVPCVLMAC